MKKMVVFMAFLIIFAGCSNLQNKENSKLELNGKATWYGKKFHGKKTASGETYDMFKMTAAHKTLYFGTKLKVTNIKNGKSVEVYINDRGPFMENVIIDLSYSAFKEIETPEKGFADVKIEVLK